MADGSVAEVKDSLAKVGYLADEPAALVSFLAQRLGKPVLVEGPDEVGKTDQEFEAMLLELLSDFQITIPELGQISATTMPIVVLTSNDSRELTEALKRRCLYLWLDYPGVEREMEIVLLHAPEMKVELARRLVEVIEMVRDLDLKKPPSIAESIDWARTLLLMGVDDIDRETFANSMSIIVKHRTDIDLVAERVGLKLPERAS